VFAYMIKVVGDEFMIQKPREKLG